MVRKKIVSDNKKGERDFTSGTVVQTPSSQQGGTYSIPTQRTKISEAMQHGWKKRNQKKKKEQKEEERKEKKKKQGRCEKGKKSILPSTSQLPLLS